VWRSVCCDALAANGLKSELGTLLVIKHYSFQWSGSIFDPGRGVGRVVPYLAMEVLECADQY
jgi:hypothetical protein